jgi:glycosyltransferase involved in cell wall biosynthesis
MRPPILDKPRVMLFNNGFLHGGTERQFVRIAQTLDRRKYDLFVGCLRRCGPFLRLIEPLGITLVEFPIRSLYGFDTMLWFWRLVQFLRRNRIAVMHAFDFYTNVFAVPAARLAGVPVVLASRRELLEVRTPWQRRAAGISCRLATGVVANSHAVEADLFRSGFAKSKKVTVIHNGIDHRADRPTVPPQQVRKKLNIPEDAPLVALVADLRPEKDIETFLRAAACIGKAIPETRFLIIGEGSDRQRLEQIALGLGLAQRALFLGDQSQVEDFLALSEVCVLSSWTESLPNAVLEAMSMARPVVATNAGGTQELVKDGETGFLVPVRDFKAMAERIMELLLDSGLSRAMGEAGRKRVERVFSCALMKDRLEALYDTLLRQRSLISNFEGLQGTSSDHGLLRRPGV